MDHIAGDIVLPQAKRHLLHILLGGVAPAGLVISQSPLLRKGTGSREVSIPLQHFPDGISTDIVVVQAASVCAEPVIGLRLLPHIKIALKGIVHKNSVHMLPGAGDEKGNTLIESLKAVHMGAGIIRIPHLIVIMPLVQESRLLPQAVEMLRPLHLLHHLKGALMQPLQGRMALALQKPYKLLADPAQRNSLPSVVCTGLPAVPVKKVRIEPVAHPQGHFPRADPQPILLFFHIQGYRKTSAALQGLGSCPLGLHSPVHIDNPGSHGLNPDLLPLKIQHNCLSVHLVICQVSKSHFLLLLSILYALPQHQALDLPEITVHNPVGRFHFSIVPGRDIRMNIQRIHSHMAGPCNIRLLVIPYHNAL